MTPLYLAFVPIFFLTFYRRMKRLAAAVKSKDRDQVKVEALFMGMVIAVSLGVLMILQRLSV